MSFDHFNYSLKILKSIKTPIPKMCHNPNLGLMTKARACKVAGQEGVQRVWGHEPSHSQVNSHCGSWNPNGFSNLQRAIAGVKTHQLEEFIISLESYWNFSEMGSHDPFEHLKHKLWPKKRLWIKLTIWFPTTKRQESTWFPRVQVVCEIPLESSRWGI
jgi:hypothetical protein